MSDWRKIEAELIRIFKDHVPSTEASGVHFVGIVETECGWDADGPRPLFADKITSIAIMPRAKHSIIDLQALAQRLARL